MPQAHSAVVVLQQEVRRTGKPVYGQRVDTETPSFSGRMSAFLVDFYPVYSGAEIVALGSCVREMTREGGAAGARSVRQRIAVNAAGLGVFEWQMDADRAIWENARMYEIFGLRQEAGPLSFEDFNTRVLHPDDRVKMLSAVDQAMRTGRFDVDVRIRRGSDGTWRNTQYYGQVEEAQGEAGKSLTGVVADVTELRKVQARARTAIAPQQLQDSLNAFVGLLRPDGTTLEANTAALEAGGITSEEVIGEKFWDAGRWSFSADSRVRLKDAVARAATGERLRYDVPIQGAGGKMLIIDFQLVPIFDKDGTVQEIVPSDIDVTERVRAQERKDVLLAELEHRVKNTLATVQRVARFSKRWAKDKEDMARSLTDRLSAISHTHDALTAAVWEGERLQTLLFAELAPYADPEGGRLRYTGDDIVLSPRNALPVGLAIHELVTNAIKHGWLS